MSGEYCRNMANQGLVSTQSFISNIPFENELMKYFFDGNITKMIINQYRTEIDTDSNYHYETREQFEETAKYLETIINSIKIKDKETLQQLNSNEDDSLKIINGLSHNLEKEFSNIHSMSTKVKILQALIIDSAFNYKKYLGITFSASIIKTSLCGEISQNMNYLIDMNYKNDEHENLLFNIIQIMINAPSENLIIEHELEKIRKARDMFGGLIYFEKLKEFYDEKLLKPYVHFFYSLIYILIKKRIKKLFSLEIELNESWIDIDEYSRKFNSIGWIQIKNHLENLITHLEIVKKAEFKIFFEYIQRYFKNYIKILLLRIKGNLYPTNSKSTTLVFERTHPILIKGINISTITGYAAMITGYTYKFVNAVAIVSDLITLTRTGILLVQIGAYGAVGILGVAAGAAAGIYTVSITIGNRIINWGSKKINIYKGKIGEFTDEFQVRKEIGRGYKINNIRYIHECISCELDNDLSKHEKYSMTKAYSYVVINSLHEGSLSSIIFLTYQINVQLTGSKTINNSEVEEKFQSLLVSLQVD